MQNNVRVGIHNLDVLALNLFEASQKKLESLDIIEELGIRLLTPAPRCEDGYILTLHVDSFLRGRYHSDEASGASLQDILLSTNFFKDSSGRNYYAITAEIIYELSPKAKASIMANRVKLQSKYFELSEKYPHNLAEDPDDLIEPAEYVMKLNFKKPSLSKPGIQISKDPAKELPKIQDVLLDLAKSIEQCIHRVHPTTSMQAPEQTLYITNMSSRVMIGLECYKSFDIIEREEVPLMTFYEGNQGANQLKIDLETYLLKRE